MICVVHRGRAGSHTHGKSTTLQERLLSSELKLGIKDDNVQALFDL